MTWFRVIAAVAAVLVLCALAGGTAKPVIEAQGRSAPDYGAIQTDYVILYAEPLRDAALAWSAYRRSVGHAVSMLAWKDFAQQADPVGSARRSVHAAFTAKVKPHGAQFQNESGTGYDVVKVDGREPGTLVNGLRYLLILGDAPDGGMKLTAPPEKFVFDNTRIPAEIHAKHKDASREPKPAMGDHFWTIAPEVGDGKFAVTCREPIAVGRVPCGTLEQARIVLGKTIQHEKAKTGDWQRKLSFVAGEGRFGAFDKMLEKMFTDYADTVVEPRYEISMTYANPTSPWTYNPNELTKRMAEAITGGSLITTYIGHGNVDRFDSMRVPTGEGKEYRFTIGERDQLVKLLKDDCSTPTIMLIVACQTGCFDNPGEPAIGEAMLYAPGGPAAVLAGSRDTHPYSNIFVQKEFVSALTEQARGDDPMTPDLLSKERAHWPWRSASWARARTMTVGAAHHAVKQYLKDAPADDYAKQIEGMASMLFSDAQRQAMNQAHLVLYNLLGDPAMRARRPAPGEGLAKVMTPKVAAGGRMEVEIDVPEALAYRNGEYAKVDGVAPAKAMSPYSVTDATLTFETWPSIVIEEQEKIDWSLLRNTPTPEWDKEAEKLQENHRKANNKVLLGPLMWVRNEELAKPSKAGEVPAAPGTCEATNCEGGVETADSVKDRVAPSGKTPHDGGAWGWKQQPLRLWMKIPADMGAGGYRVRLVLKCEVAIPDETSAKKPSKPSASNPLSGKIVVVNVPLSLDVDITEAVAEDAKDGAAKPAGADGK